MAHTRPDAPPRTVTPRARFRLLGLIGTGGTAEVYDAFDLRLRRRVALKFVVGTASLRTAEQQLWREARILAPLSHPNICVAHDVTEHAGRPCLVMEHLQGRDLKSTLASTTPHWREVVRVAADLLAGLAAAHRAGVVHQDIKPSNVFVTTDSRVKLLDFGAASSPTVRASRLRSVLGTAEYIAPERLVGCAPLPQSDLFSLGAVLYEMLTGRKAFAAATNAGTLLRVIDHHPAPLRNYAPEVPPALQQIVMRLLAKRCVDRYASADQVRADLLALDFGGRARPRLPLDGRRERTGRHHVHAA